MQGRQRSLQGILISPDYIEQELHWGMSFGKILRGLVFLTLVFCMFKGIAFANEFVLLKGDGLKRDATLSDMQKYVGGLADVSRKAREAFIGQMPGILSVAKDNMNAIAVHQELSKGAYQERLKTYSTTI